MFCFECGFKLVDGSKFCSSCGTPQAGLQNFEVTLKLFSESWIEDFEAAEDEEAWASECVFRSHDEIGLYLTFAENAEQSLANTPFSSTLVDFSISDAPAVGSGVQGLDQLTSAFQDGNWEFELRWEYYTTLAVAALSEPAAREICAENVVKLFGLWETPAHEVTELADFEIVEVLDEVAVAEKKASWDAAITKS